MSPFLSTQNSGTKKDWSRPLQVLLRKLQLKFNRDEVKGSWDYVRR